MKQIGVAIVGTGWCGGIRAEICAAHPLVKSLHLAETRPERLEEMARKTNAKSRTGNYKDLLDNPTPWSLSTRAWSSCCNMPRSSLSKYET